MQFSIKNDYSTLRLYSTETVNTFLLLVQLPLGPWISPIKFIRDVMKRKPVNENVYGLAGAS